MIVLIFWSASPMCGENPSKKKRRPHFFLHHLLSSLMAGLFFSGYFLWIWSDTRAPENTLETLPNWFPSKNNDLEIPVLATLTSIELKAPKTSSPVAKPNGTNSYGFPDISFFWGFRWGFFCCEFWGREFLGKPWKMNSKKAPTGPTGQTPKPNVSK